MYWFQYSPCEIATGAKWILDIFKFIWVSVNKQKLEFLEFLAWKFFLYKLLVQKKVYLTVSTWMNLNNKLAQWTYWICATSQLVSISILYEKKTTRGSYQFCVLVKFPLICSIRNRVIVTPIYRVHSGPNCSAFQTLLSIHLLVFFLMCVTN